MLFRNSITYLLLFAVTVSIILLIVFRSYIPGTLASIFSPVSVVSKVTSKITSLDSTDGRTNFLVIGVDRRSSGSVGTLLTDTIMVISLDENAKNAVIVSIPRDLWVNSRKVKINAVYAFSNKDIKQVKEVVEEIAGLPIHYYGIINFDAFVDAIDAVGGVKIDVINSFDDYLYPIEGKENAMPESERYEHLKFNAGEQIMDGETALKFARSRHSINPREAGDFARARRQQQVIVSLKDKILSTETLSNPNKLVELYDAYKDNVETSFPIAGLPILYDKYQNFSDGTITRIVLSNEPMDKKNPGTGLLKAPSEEDRMAMYNGQYVLIPIDPSYNEIHSIVRTYMFGDN